MKMPMYKSTMRDGIFGCDGGAESQVLDLDTAVKDGVLGGVPTGGFCVGVGKKLDLRKMVEELNLPEVPPVFICPISLEPMQDPVTLSTGQTYERSNILKWFSLGHYTCPTTMQELWDDTITPNTTLYHLIYTWFSQRYLQMKKKSEDVQERASEHLATLKKVKGQARVQVLKELKQVVAAHANARTTVVSEGGAGLLSSLLGPFTSHAVGSECKREGFLQKIKDEVGEGCNMYGFLEVNKVAGNFHFAPGKSFQQSNVYVHDLQAFQMDSFNISHRINRLAFGDYFPGVVNPLDGVEWTQEPPSGMYQYFIKVEPTVYTDARGSAIQSNQALPGVFFFYDLSPIKVTFTEENVSFLHFLTNVCAIVSGVFTVSGILDSFICHGQKAIKKKMEIGKFS